MLIRIAALCMLLAAASACARPPTACQLNPVFVPLQVQVPDRVGTCSGPEVEQPELGQITQPTTGGLLVYSRLDQVVSFSDDWQTWVLDPHGQVAQRSPAERFPFEFNADGLPLVGQPEPATDAPCPTSPVRVLAVENFYASLVNQVGGQCVTTTTLLSDPDADPHEFQPTANDVRAFQNAQLLVENGLGYDDFADRIVGTMQSPPTRLRAGDIVGLEVGANPHVWYGAGYVEQIRSAILANLKTLNPEAAGYYDAQAAVLDQRFTTYHNLIDQIASRYGDVPVGATESIFENMANTTRLNLVSPPEFMQAMSEGNELTARDMALFQNQITSRQIKVLVYNTQTVTNLTDQLMRMAEQNDIPVVGVSETMPPGAQTFQGWQASELQQLRLALQKATGAS
jgi:zinc/manganese transport system substrate-binding protein